MDENNHKQDTPENSSNTNETNWLEDIRISTVFLTRLPLHLVRVPDGPAVTRAMRAFPVVGLGLGILAAIVFSLLIGLGLSNLAGAFAIMILLSLLTGALHEDALADVADGFGGGQTKERKLEIMSDSRVGAYGVVALVLLLGLKAALIAQLGEQGLAVAALVAGASLSRAAMVAARALLAPAKSNGLSGSGGQPDPAVVAQALIVAALVALIALPLSQAFAAMLAAALLTVAFCGLAKRQIGGQTGDVLGATQQISELAVFATIVMMAS